MIAMNGFANDAESEQEDDALLKQVCCIVVHHESWATLKNALDSLMLAGVEAQAIFVVDNSSYLATGVIEDIRLKGFHFEHICNRGYANAVNFGIRLIRATKYPRPYLLVATHDIVLDNHALAEMVRVARSTGATAVGPVLCLDIHEPLKTVWSRGGKYARWTGLPMHKRSLASTPTGSGHSSSVEWLDGACVIYDAAQVMQNSFREDYFMYFEEVDYHARMRDAGRLIVCATGAHVQQASSGIPSYLLTRNATIFLRARNQQVRAGFAPLYCLVKEILVGTILRRRRVSLRGLAYGVWDGRRHRTIPPGVPYAEVDRVRKRLNSTLPRRLRKRRSVG